LKITSYESTSIDLEKLTQRLQRLL